MKNMCRELCEKYTSLGEEQIREIMTWLDELPKIADSEDCNVYIDCMSFYGRSFVVVAEAQPKGKPSLYDRPIIGSIIKPYKEPAVERAFASGQPTVGVAGLEMPSAKRVVQSAYPILFKDEVIAVLIYEKGLEEYNPASADEPEEVSLTPEILSFLEELTDAVLVLDRNGRVSCFNTAARKLFRQLGYIDSLKGMGIENIISFKDSRIQEFSMSGRSFQAKKVLMDAKQGVEGVVIRDMTELEKTRQSLKKSRLVKTELRHSMKNGLRLLEFADRKCADRAKDESARSAYLDAVGRIGALRALTEVKLENGEASIKAALEQISREMLTMLNGQRGRIDILIEGDEFRLQGDISNVVILVIYELICNALKYAFSEKPEGQIRVWMKDEGVLYTFGVEDNGCGFELSPEVWESSVGLGMIRSMVKDWLDGELRIHSDEKGTKVVFEVIE